MGKLRGAHTHRAQYTERAGLHGYFFGLGGGREVSYARNNAITANLVYDHMRTLFDGGGIYTLGPSPFSRVTRNYVHHQQNLFGALYHDNGSGDFYTAENVVAQSPKARWLLMNPPDTSRSSEGGMSFQPALMLGTNYIDDQVLGLVNSCSPPSYCSVATPSVTRAGQAWPWEAVKIMQEAGASAYW